MLISMCTWGNQVDRQRGFKRRVKDQGFSGTMERLASSCLSLAEEPMCKETESFKPPHKFVNSHCGQ
jgi:hypothetical protein